MRKELTYLELSAVLRNDSESIRAGISLEIIFSSWRLRSVQNSQHNSNLSIAYLHSYDEHEAAWSNKILAGTDN